MIDPICDKCGAELQQPGALMFSPPNSHSEVKKYHLCVGCWCVVMAEIKLGPTPTNYDQR